MSNEYTIYLLRVDVFDLVLKVIIKHAEDVILIDVIEHLPHIC